jgi:hypothetical protein
LQIRLIRTYFSEKRKNTSRTYFCPNDKVILSPHSRHRSSSRNFAPVICNPRGSFLTHPCSEYCTQREVRGHRPTPETNFRIELRFKQWILFIPFLLKATGLKLRRREAGSSPESLLWRVFFALSTKAEHDSEIRVEDSFNQIESHLPSFP